MASNLKYSAALKNAQMAALTTEIGVSGNLLIYGGAQPASPDVAVGAQPLLATLPCSATFAPAPAAGVLTLNPLTNGTGTAAAAGGTNATFFRFEQSGGTPHIDGSIGTAGADLNLTGTVSIATGQPVAVSAFTFSNQN